MKILEYSFINENHNSFNRTQARTSKTDRYLDFVFYKLYKLKEFNFYESTMKSSERYDFKLEKACTFRERPHLKKFVFAWNAASEWYHIL